MNALLVTRSAQLELFTSCSLSAAFGFAEAGALCVVAVVVTMGLALAFALSGRFARFVIEGTVSSEAFVAVSAFSLFVVIKAVVGVTEVSECILPSVALNSLYFVTS